MLSDAVRAAAVNLAGKSLIAALLGFPFAVKWPGRGGRVIPVMTCIAMAAGGA